MGQLERYGLYVLVLVIFLILGVAIWGGEGPANGPQEEQDGPDFAHMLAMTGGNGGNGGATPLERIVDQVNGGRGSAGAGRSAARGTDDSERRGADRGESRTRPAPTTREHVVRKGDNLEEISKRYLGKRSRWRELLDINPGLDPKKLQLGQRIVVPGAGSAAPRTDVEHDGRDVVGRDYVVKSGDNPSRISKREFGTEDHAKLILKLNPDLDPLKMKPGQTIRIPKKNEVR